MINWTPSLPTYGLREGGLRWSAAPRTSKEKVSTERPQAPHQRTPKVIPRRTSHVAIPRGGGTSRAEGAEDGPETLSRRHGRPGLALEALTGRGFIGHVALSPYQSVWLSQVLMVSDQVTTRINTKVNQIVKMPNWQVPKGANRCPDKACPLRKSETEPMDALDSKSDG